MPVFKPFLPDVLQCVNEQTSNRSRPGHRSWRTILQLNRPVSDLQLFVWTVCQKDDLAGHLSAQSQQIGGIGASGLRLGVILGLDRFYDFLWRGSERPKFGMRLGIVVQSSSDAMDTAAITNVLKRPPHTLRRSEVPKVIRRKDPALWLASYSSKDFVFN